MEWRLRLALPFRLQMLKRRPPVWSGVKSGAKGAPNAVSSGADVPCLSG